MGEVIPTPQMCCKDQTEWHHKVAPRRWHQSDSPLTRWSYPQSVGPESESWGALGKQTPGKLGSCWRRRRNTWWQSSLRMIWHDEGCELHTMRASLGRGWREEAGREPECPPSPLQPRQQPVGLKKQRQASARLRGTRKARKLDLAVGC